MEMLSSRLVLAKVIGCRRKGQVCNTSKGLGPLCAHPPSTNLDVLGVRMEEEQLGGKLVPILHLTLTINTSRAAGDLLLYKYSIINYTIIMNLCNTKLSSEIKT